MKTKMRADKAQCLVRDKICRICGQKKVAYLTLHHIFPERHQFRDRLWAKTIICKRCHRLINHFWNKSQKPIELSLEESYIKD